MTVHLKISKSNAQAVIEKLKHGDMIDRNYQVQRNDDFVFVPIKEEFQGKVKINGQTVDIEPVISRNRNRPRTTGGAFDLIGNIAITKIRNETRAHELAEELLGSHPTIKSVYLDKGIIGEYRLRDLELLAGENNFIAVYRENGLVFELDVSKVYFSPRLATERMFVAKDSKDGEYVIDMFAGIGAFSLNLAKHKAVKISAIDSNPDAVFYMEKCLELNSLKGNIQPIRGKAEEAIGELPLADRIIMNLPHESRSFLGIAADHLKIGGIIHYYEILGMSSLAERMEEIRDLGFEIQKKREVHGYSASLSMYSLTASYLGG